MCSEKGAGWLAGSVDVWLVVWYGLVTVWFRRSLSRLRVCRGGYAEGVVVVRGVVRFDYSAVRAVRRYGMVLTD